ncbi:MAG TPA: ABC transporter permease, partial [Chitinophagaceae bacterium]
MFKNYFKIALRNITRQKTLAFINIFGLSVGIACFILFSLYAINEFTFDHLHKNSADTYLVMGGDGKPNPKAIGGYIFTPMPLGPAMKQELPGVEQDVRYVQPYETFIKVNNEGRRENIAYADPSFFKVFSFKFKYGSPREAISDLHSMTLTEETAKRIFGKANAIGRTVQVKIENVFETFVVTAITDNPPANSSFQFSMLVNFGCLANTLEGKMDDGNWGMNSFVTFIQLKHGSTLSSNNKLLADFKQSHFPKSSSSVGGYDLEALGDMHTNPELVGLKVSPLNAKMIWILLSIAAGVLLIACINFTTLSIGRSVNRAKEVGVRKVIGGTRKALVIQFLTESIIFTILSTSVGLLLANILLPSFNHLSGRELSFSFTQIPQLPALIIGLVLVVSLIAGGYPALILSGFNAVQVLKSKIKLGGANFFTKALVTFQFVLSAGLIISAIIIMQQLSYMQSRSPGFEKENVVQIKALGVANTPKIFPVLKHELSAYPQIVRSCSSDNGLGEREGMNFTGFEYKGKSINISQFYIDPDFIPTLDMHLLAGRNFNPSIASDTVNAVIINEATMNELGWTKENSIGQHLAGYGNFSVKDPTVIGIVRDFNFKDLTQKVEPLLFHQFASSRINP